MCNCTLANHALWTMHFEPCSVKPAAFSLPRTNCKSLMCDLIILEIHNTIVYVIINIVFTVTEDIILSTLACLGCSSKSIRHHCKFPEPIARPWAKAVFFSVESLFIGNCQYATLEVQLWKDIQPWKDSFASELLLGTFCTWNRIWIFLGEPVKLHKSTRMLISPLFFGTYTADAHQGLLLGLMIPSCAMTSSCLLLVLYNERV